MKLLIFIPARSGSKGIKNKNMADLNKRPLIYYTLNIAKKIRRNAYLFISTDSKKIIKYCKRFGFENRYLRPKSLSKDNSSMFPAVMHGVRWIKKNYGKTFDAILLLQPTTPIRQLKELKLAINLFRKEKLKSLISVTHMKEHPYECIRLSGNKWNYLACNPKKTSHRQNYKKNFYFIDGAFALAKIDFLKKNKSFINNKNTKFFVQKRERAVDINTPEDLSIAKALMKKK